MSDDCLRNTGIVSTAFIADATPAAMTAHTADRGQYPHVVDTYLNGITNVRQSSEHNLKKLHLKPCTVHLDKLDWP